MVSHRARVSRREDAATMSIYPARVRRESKDGRRMISCSQRRPRHPSPLSVERPSALSRREKQARASSLGVSFNRGTHPSFATGATTAARALTVLRAAENLGAREEAALNGGDRRHREVWRGGCSGFMPGSVGAESDQDQDKVGGSSGQEEWPNHQCSHVIGRELKLTLAVMADQAI